MAKIKKLALTLTLIIGFVFILSTLSADITLDRQNRLDFAHVVYMSNISTTPTNIAPGQNFMLQFTLTNNGSQFVKDVITQILLPTEFTTFNDVSTIKTAQLNPGESLNVKFNLISKPGTKEDIYDVPISVDYLNYIGDERVENETLGIILGSIPTPIVELKSTDIYKGNDLGKATINVVNNNLANIRFLAVKLLPSPDYDIISSDLSYVGDLDSSDSQAVDFRIKVKDDSKQTNLQVLLTYKDSINRDYTMPANVTLEMRTAKELGIAAPSKVGWVILVLIILAAAYYFYRRNKAKKLALANKNKFK